MASVFIVKACGGEYSDSFDYEIKAFLDENKAAKFRDHLAFELKAKIKHCKKVARWYDKWCKAHPTPEFITMEYPDPSVAFYTESVERKEYEAKFEADYKAHSKRVREHNELWYEEYKLYAKKFNFAVADIEDIEMVFGNTWVQSEATVYYVTSVELE